MNDEFSQMMTPFDQSISTHSLHMLKLLIPFLPPQSQRMIAIYVKFLEFQNTLTYFHRMQQKSFDDLKGYLPRSAVESFDNIMNMINMMNMFQEMQGEEFDPMSMMADMLTPEQQDMFQMYQTQQQKEGDAND